MTQRMQRRSISHFFHYIEVLFQLVTLVGKVCSHLFDKRLTPIGKAEPLSLQTHHVISVGV